MKLPLYTLIAVLVLCFIPGVVWSCSCPPDSWLRTSQQSIRNDFCYMYNTNVYVGTVVEASCNCVQDFNDTDARVNCQSYSVESRLNSVVSAETIGQGISDCSFVVDRDSYYSPVKDCSDLTAALVPSDYTVNTSVAAASTAAYLESCMLACPFNSDLIYYGGQPCQYTILVDTVLKGSYQVGDTILAVGPDVLTTCGNPTRTLVLQQQYVVGIGGPCSHMSEWTSLDDYSNDDIAFLTELSESYEADPSACDEVTSSTIIMSTTIDRTTAPTTITITEPSTTATSINEAVTPSSTTATPTSEAVTQTATSTSEAVTQTATSTSEVVTPSSTTSVRPVPIDITDGCGTAMLPLSILISTTILGMLGI